MRKLKSVIIMILTVFFIYGCASQMPYDDEPNLYGDLTYDFNKMTFTETLDYDIMYHLGNPMDDFVILHQEILGISLTENEFVKYQNLFDLLIELSVLTNQDIGLFLSYSSTDLKNTLDNHDLVLTLDTIVTFNGLKIIINDLKQSKNILKIKTIDYIKARISSDLSESQIQGLEILQAYQKDVLYHNASFKLYTASLDDLIVIYETLGFIPTDLEKQAIDDALEMIKNLKEN